MQTRVVSCELLQHIRCVQQAQHLASSISILDIVTLPTGLSEACSLQPRSGSLATSVRVVRVPRKSQHQPASVITRLLIPYNASEVLSLLDLPLYSRRCHVVRSLQGTLEI